MPQRCPQCRAALPEGRTCDALFEQCLALEYADPRYGQVHFLTVVSFMVQHGRYSDQALAQILPVLRAAVAADLPGPHVRTLAREVIDASRRTWPITRPAGAAAPPGAAAWSMTIVDVARSLADANLYREAVRAWAQATVDDMSPTGA